MEIRTGEFEDVAGITDIFNFYIEHTNARFEEFPFTLENREEWFSQFSRTTKYQIYVAVENGVLQGFACSQKYRAIPAFDDTVEVSVYLAQEAKGKGLGSKLYTQLFSSMYRTKIIMDRRQDNKLMSRDYIGNLGVKRDWF
ncbi:TPA: N-acetyltransferase [Vibrio cholerae]|nr:N-acetyltransferase [Vibrio cholerae]